MMNERRMKEEYQPWLLLCIPNHNVIIPSFLGGSCLFPVTHRAQCSTKTPQSTSFPIFSIIVIHFPSLFPEGRAQGVLLHKNICNLTSDRIILPPRHITITHMYNSSFISGVQKQGGPGCTSMTQKRKGKKGLGSYQTPPSTQISHRTQKLRIIASCNNQLQNWGAQSSQNSSVLQLLGSKHLMPCLFVHFPVKIPPKWALPYAQIFVTSQAVLTILSILILTSLSQTFVPIFAQSPGLARCLNQKPWRSCSAFSNLQSGKYC